MRTEIRKAQELTKRRCWSAGDAGLHEIKVWLRKRMEVQMHKSTEARNRGLDYVLQRWKARL